MQNAQWIHISAAGAVGGLLGWLIAATYPGYFDTNMAALDVAKFILGGAVAAMAGVYLLANTDTTNFARSASFAAMCGLAWPAILETSLQMVQTATQDRPLASATQDVRNNLNAVQTAPNESSITALTAATLTAAEKIPEAASPEAKQDAIDQTRSVINTLGMLKTSNPDINPHIRAALKKLSLEPSIPSELRDAAQATLTNGNGVGNGAPVTPQSAP